jgi:hypothetical protein
MALLLSLQVNEMNPPGLLKVAIEPLLHLQGSWQYQPVVNTIMENTVKNKEKSVDRSYACKKK